MSDVKNAIDSFLSNASQVKVVSTIILFVAAIYFLFLGLWEVNILIIFSFGSFVLQKILSTILGLGMLFVAYAMYTQNRRIVNESLQKARKKIVKGARNLNNRFK